jgi:2-dehydro-3-deoxygluconokinase
VDVLFVSPEDLALLTGRDAQSGELADEVVDKFGIGLVVIRQREDFGPGIVGTRVHVHGESGTEAVAQGQVVDEIGAGDAATGAFLAAMLTGADLARSCMLCARAYARMVTIPGDAWSGGLDDLMDNYAPYRRVSR